VGLVHPGSRAWLKKGGTTFMAEANLNKNGTDIPNTEMMIPCVRAELACLNDRPGVDWSHSILVMDRCLEQIDRFMNRRERLIEAQEELIKLHEKNKLMQEGIITRLRAGPGAPDTRPLAIRLIDVLIKEFFRKDTP
jgi:hypothetical protein